MSGRLVLPCVSAVAVLMFAATVARGDVFNMPAGQTSLQTVFVGDPGNVGDTVISQGSSGAVTGLGAVGYSYYMGTYEVTNAQYCQFLNAKLPAISDAASSASDGVLPSDTYGLYDVGMALSTRLKSGDIVSEGVTYDPNGATGGKFSVLSAYANNPVVYVSGFDALRFCNWLQNGQNAGDTESGTYAITNGSPNFGTIPSNLRSGEVPAAGHWVLPTENEWYKAAYYKGGGTNSGYWLYPTSSNTPPTGFPPGQNPDPTNAANYDDLVAGQPKPNNALIPVGSYPQSLSPYGTLDQGGNAMEWTETPGRLHPAGWWSDADNGQVIVRGGDFNSAVSDLSSTQGVHEHMPWADTDFFGFRVAYVGVLPEPGSFSMLAGIAIMTLLYWRPHA